MITSSRFQTAIIVSCELEHQPHTHLSYSSREHVLFKGRCGAARREEEGDLGGINKSEQRHGRKGVAKKHIIKNKNKNEFSLNECSSFSLNNVKEMLKAGFAEGRRRAEQLVNLALQTGLRSGVVEKVSNGVYRVRTDPEKPEADPTYYDDDDNKSDSSKTTYSTSSRKGSQDGTDRSETSEDSCNSRRSTSRRPTRIYRLEVGRSDLLRVTLMFATELQCPVKITAIMMLVEVTLRCTVTSMDHA
ncbi:unnamed protein product [Timema podura]|uniref:Uncharacterized protein n=1 Tax=Timema podura TaxID=61482 RepID=A0ABN7P1U2_TIMPD|nr:unnamed protein product [Timema podura]